MNPLQINTKNNYNASVAAHHSFPTEMKQFETPRHSKLVNKFCSLAQKNQFSKIYTLLREISVRIVNESERAAKSHRFKEIREHLVRMNRSPNAKQGTLCGYSAARYRSSRFEHLIYFFPDSRITELNTFPSSEGVNTRKRTVSCDREDVFAQLVAKGFTVCVISVNDSHMLFERIDSLQDVCPGFSVPLERIPTGKVQSRKRKSPSSSPSSSGAPAMKRRKIADRIEDCTPTKLSAAKLHTSSESPVSQDVPLPQQKLSRFNPLKVSIAPQAFDSSFFEWPVANATPFSTQGEHTEAANVGTKTQDYTIQHHSSTSPQKDSLSWLRIETSIDPDLVYQLSPSFFFDNPTSEAEDFFSEI